MLYAERKIKKILDELYKNIYTDTEDIKEFYKKEGYYKSLCDVDNCDLPFEKIKTEEFWGGIDRDSWYRFEVEIPERFKGKKVAIFVSTGEYDLEKEETTTNPQILFYLDGEIKQGFDINHREYVLTDYSNGKEKYKVDLKVNSGMFDRKFYYVIKLVTIDEDTRRLYYDIRVPYQAVVEMEESDYMKNRIIGILEDALNIIDFRKVDSEEYLLSVKESIEFLHENFYLEECGKHDISASVIGHTHIDVAWLWTVAQTREKVARSFSTVLSLMDQYPEYKFMSSSPLLYQFLKEDYPDLYEKVKDKITEGRWEADGGMWVESDCNMVSGRSFSRQFLYGNRFFEKEFGVSCKVLWLPDVFGYCPSLPQIMKKSGIDYFVSCKMGWSDTNRLPNDTFYWKGIDGTEVLSHMITTTYPRQSVTSYATDYNGQLFPETVMGAWNTYRQQDINKDVLVTFGYGDGGGGPTKEMLETQRRMSKGIPRCPRTNMRTIGEYFSDLENEIAKGKKLPKWHGELYLETHRGTYTSMARNKKSNRYCDILLGQTEKLGSIAMLFGDEYPSSQLEENWKVVLMNQFHDILPGSAIKPVYEVTKKEYSKIELESEGYNRNSISMICDNISTKADSIVVFNTLGFDRTDIVNVEYRGSDTFSLLDTKSNEVVDIQEIENGFVFLAKDIPALGYKTYRIEKKSSRIDVDEKFYMDLTGIENKHYSIDIDPSGAFKSIYDKESKREILMRGQLGNRLVCYENKPYIFDNWNIDRNYKNKSWDIDEVESIEVIEDGSIRKVLEIKKKFMDSSITQKICVYRDLKRIDFDTVLDMKMTDVLVKCEFPLDINTDYGSFETAFGSIRRSSHSNTSWDMSNFEVPGHRWGDISESNYGVSLLNDSRYGYSIKDNVLGLSLVKPGTYPNPDADIETHEFRYSLYPHLGDVYSSGCHKEAEKINEALFAVYSEAKIGKFEENLSFIEVDCDNIIIDTIKKCEDSNEIIVTIYEYGNRRARGKLKTFFNIEQACECDLMEKSIRKLNFDNNFIEFEIKPFEIKSFKILFSTEELI